MHHGCHTYCGTVFAALNASFIENELHRTSATHTLAHALSFFAPSVIPLGLLLLLGHVLRSLCSLGCRVAVHELANLFAQTLMICGFDDNDRFD